MSSAEPPPGGSGPRVLFVTSSFPRWPGDATTPFVLHLAADLRARGVAVDVLAPHAPGAALAERIDGVPVRRFRYFWPPGRQAVCYSGGALINLRRSRAARVQVPALVVAELAAVARAARAGSYELVHSHWALPQGFVAQLARGRRPHVLTVHGGDIFALRSPLLAAAKRLPLSRADAVTVNSAATERAVLAVAPRARVTRIPIGTDVDPRPDPARVAALRARLRRPDGPLLVFVGRLVAEKGVLDVVAALAAAAGSLPGTTAALAGAGQDEADLRALADRLGVADRVHLLGWLPPAEVAALQAAADVVLAPSRQAASGWTEAQGLTVVEALAAGRPVVATAVGGIPELVEDGTTGLLVPPEDPAALAAAVRRLAGDPDLGARLGGAGRERVRRTFSRERTAEAFARLYADLLSRPGSAPPGRRAAPPPR